jgi:hypothetical protein
MYHLDCDKESSYATGKSTDFNYIFLFTGDEKITVVIAIMTFNLHLYCEMKFIVVSFEVNKGFKDRI